MPDIAIVNASQVLSDADVERICEALAAQDGEDFAPAWNLPPATYHFFPFGKMPDKSMWGIFLNRHSTDPGALGWHDDTAGLVFSRVFVGDDIKYGASPSVTISHEALEMRGNPNLTGFYTAPNGDKTPREASDAVEADELGYDKLGVRVSNFVLSAYYSAGPGPYDFRGVLKAPFPHLTPGGYVSVLPHGSGSWHQITARRLDGSLSYRSQRHGRGTRLR